MIERVEIYYGVIFLYTNQEYKNFCSSSGFYFSLDIIGKSHSVFSFVF